MKALLTITIHLLSFSVFSQTIPPQISGPCHPYDTVQVGMIYEIVTTPPVCSPYEIQYCSIYLKCPGAHIKYSHNTTHYHPFVGWFEISRWIFKAKETGFLTQTLYYYDQNGNRKELPVSFYVKR